MPSNDQPAAWRHPLRWLGNKIVERLAQEIADALADELAPRIQRELMKRSVARV